ncbi:MAC/perforin domain protein [Medicago truncatula]|uniref:MAC/perforin domain protein n=1 Tax=Medicago truncatula TaxID=3880 RepID=A0A072V919_MEDTR|nr:MAC/perforin domain protein [Medicago truncatula]
MTECVNVGSKKSKQVSSFLRTQFLAPYFVELSNLFCVNFLSKTQSKSQKKKNHSNIIRVIGGEPGTNSRVPNSGTYAYWYASNSH